MTVNDEAASIVVVWCTRCSGVVHSGYRSLAPQSINELKRSAFLGTQQLTDGSTPAPWRPWYILARVCFWCSLGLHVMWSSLVQVIHVGSRSVVASNCNWLFLTLVDGAVVLYRLLFHKKTSYHVCTEQTALSIITVNNYNATLVQGTIKKEWN